MKKYCLALDLKNNEALIQEYEAYHRAVWPEILQSIKDAGILNMEIYRVANRLFMIMETEDDFSFERKKEMDERNPKVKEWEELMWKYQQAMPGTLLNEKWILANCIFKLP